MSDINAPIQIPSELNVPEPTSDNEAIKPIKPKSATAASSSADAGKQYPKHRLQLDAKSKSMFNFSATSHSNENTEPEKETNEDGAPVITLSPPSATYRNSADRKSAGSTRSLDHIDNVTQKSDMRHISASTNEMKLSVNRNRANSMIDERDDDEFDELEPNSKTGSQLRIRSSIVSLFGRMGKMRRTSSISQSSANGVNGGVGNDHGPPLRALPQIAATKILRAFSYVGKLYGNAHSTL